MTMAIGSTLGAGGLIDFVRGLGRNGHMIGSPFMEGYCPSWQCRLDRNSCDALASDLDEGPERRIHRFHIRKELGS